jgi:hypothetical protein
MMARTESLDRRLRARGWQGQLDHRLLGHQSLQLLASLWHDARV